jgi:hypothetical protein
MIAAIARDTMATRYEVAIKVTGLRGLVTAWTGSDAATAREIAEDFRTGGARLVYVDRVNASGSVVARDVIKGR